MMGDNVKIRDLVKAAKYNGRVGSVLNYVAAEERYRVRLIDGEILKVKLKNLERMETPPSSPMKNVVDLPDSPTSISKKDNPSVLPPTSPSNPSTTTTTTTQSSSSVKDSFTGFFVKSKRTASKFSFFTNKLSILSANAMGRTRTGSMDPDTVQRVKALRVFRKTLKSNESAIKKFRSSVVSMRNAVPVATKHVPRPNQNQIKQVYDDLIKEIDEVLLVKTRQHTSRLDKVFNGFKQREVLSNDLKASIKDLSFLRKHSKRFQEIEINTQSDKVSKLQNDYDVLERTLRNDVEDLSSSAGNVLHAIFRMFQDAQLQFFENVTKATSALDLETLVLDDAVAEKKDKKTTEEKEEVALPDGDDI